VTGEHWAMLIVIGFVVYRFATRKQRKANKELQKRKRQWAAENALPEVDSNMRVILESIDLFRKTKNQETARSRYNLALERLENLLQRFPHRSDWQDLLEGLQQEGRAVLQASLAASIAKQVEKAGIAKTVSTKITYLNRALMELSEARNSGEYDEEWINTQRASLEELVHNTELGKLLETAERYEFKEDWKKALSAYQDVLFFLKKDNIDDDEQVELFCIVNGKIEMLKTRP